MVSFYFHLRHIAGNVIGTFNAMNVRTMIKDAKIGTQVITKMQVRTTLPLASLGAVLVRSPCGSQQLNFLVE